MPTTALAVLLLGQQAFVGTWKVEAPDQWPKNTMEHEIASRLRISIFADGTWQRKIFSVTEGRWKFEKGVLVLTVLRALHDSHPLPENSRYKLEGNMRRLLFLRDPRLKLVRVSSKPFKYKFVP